MKYLPSVRSRPLVKGNEDAGYEGDTVADTINAIYAQRMTGRLVVIPSHTQ